MSWAKKQMGDSPTPNLGESSDPPPLLVPRNDNRMLLDMLRWLRLVALHPDSLTPSERAQLETMTTRAREISKILSRSTGIDLGSEFPSQASARPGMIPTVRSLHGYRFLPLSCPSMPLFYQHRQNLSYLVDTLTMANQWKDACGALSVLLKGTPHGSSWWNDERNFIFAMEIQQRFARAGSHYQIVSKTLYDFWMLSDKRNAMMLIWAHFSCLQRNIEEALCNTKLLLQDPEMMNHPLVNLLHGLILYEMWYSGLPEDMKIKGRDIHIPPQTSDTTITDSYEEPDAFVSSNQHNAINVEDGNGSSIVASESSICVEKNILDFKETTKQKNNSALHATEPSCSIFLSHGLEKSLLPLQFDHLKEDIERVIHSYRGLVNEQYNDAVKHLRLALHSTPPCSAALLPLVQLHLLGDRVEEALKELDGCCQNSNVSQPFRLKARILECFQSNQVATICSCYEAALRRDSTCNQSLQRLIKMHRIGNYGTVPLFEMIILNLDSTDGESSTWEEFAVCFLKILTSSARDFEDHISTTGQRVSTTLVSDKIPSVYTEGHQVRETWEDRCRWWRNRHFSENAYLKDMQHGDKKRLASKAACASHMYGPHFGYVEAVCRSLTNTEDASSLSFLQPHLMNSTMLEEHLGVDDSLSSFLFG